MPLQNHSCLPEQSTKDYRIIIGGYQVDALELKFTARDSVLEVEHRMKQISFVPHERVKPIDYYIL